MEKFDICQSDGTNLLQVSSAIKNDTIVCTVSVATDALKDTRTKQERDRAGLKTVHSLALLFLGEVEEKLNGLKVPAPEGAPEAENGPNP